MCSILLRDFLYHRSAACILVDRAFRVRDIVDETGLLGAGGAGGYGASLFQLLPELEGSEAPLLEVMDGKAERWQIEWVNRTDAQGEITYLRLTSLPYRNEHGNGDGLVLIVEDVTDLGRTQQALIQSRNEVRLAQEALARRNLDLAAANAEVRRLSDLKTTFVSMAVHELRNPLAIIRAYVSVLQDGSADSLDQRQRESLEIIKRTTERLNELAVNLLDVTRLETGHMELILQPLDLGALLASVARTARPSFDAAHQELVIDLGDALPPAMCDELRATQIFANLLSNAHKYTRAGGRVEVQLRLDDAAGDLEVTIADTGVGIPLADQPKLFDRFFRASNAAETGASGAGMGLYITRSLVELHGGRIWFESQPGSGTIFHVTFPAVEPDPSWIDGETESS